MESFALPAGKQNLWANLDSGKVIFDKKGKLNSRRGRLVDRYNFPIRVREPFVFKSPCRFFIAKYRPFRGCGKGSKRFAAGFFKGYRFVQTINEGSRKKSIAFVKFLFQSPILNSNILKGIDESDTKLWHSFSYLSQNRNMPSQFFNP